MDLHELSRLQVFALCATIRCGAQETWVLADINAVLHTISPSNRITNLWFQFTIYSEPSFDGSLDQPWAELCGEAIRISAQKPLEFDVKVIASTGRIGSHPPGSEGLYTAIKDKMTSISNWSNICLHYWNPTSRRLGISPPPRGQVRGRCRRT